MPVTEKICKLNFGFNANVKIELDAVRAVKPGPPEFALVEPKITTLGGSQARILKKGEKYQICAKLIYLELVGDLEPEVFYNVTVIDLSSCDVVKSLCFSCKDKLKCDTTQVDICMEFTCDHDGVFSTAITASLGDSDLFDFECFEFCFACHPSCIFPEVKTEARGHGHA